MSRELDEQVARALGRRIYDGPVPHDDIQLIDEGSWCGVPGYGLQPTTTECPYYSGDSATTPTLLAEIDRWDLSFEYIRALADILDVPLREIDSADVWRMLSATPEQHAKAFLSAMLASGQYRGHE